MNVKSLFIMNLAGLVVMGMASVAMAASSPERKAWFGDTHGHSPLSSDAFAFGNTLLPDNACKLARGDEAKLVNGETTRLKVPQDFFMMTDHAEMIGIATMALDPKSPVYKGPMGDALRDPDQMKAGAKFLYALQAAAGTGKYPAGYSSGSIKTVWQDIVARITESNTHAATGVGLERYCRDASDLRAANHSC